MTDVRGWGLSEQHLLPDAVVAFVDGELSPTAHDRASAHLARCAVCAGEIVAQRQARSAVQSADAPVRAGRRCSRACGPSPSRSSCPSMPDGLADHRGRPARRRAASRPAAAFGAPRRWDRPPSSARAARSSAVGPAVVPRRAPVSSCPGSCSVRSRSSPRQRWRRDRRAHRPDGERPARRRRRTTSSRPATPATPRPLTARCSAATPTLTAIMRQVGDDEPASRDHRAGQRRARRTASAVPRRRERPTAGSGHVRCAARRSTRRAPPCSAARPVWTARSPRRPAAARAATSPS